MIYSIYIYMLFLNEKDPSPTTRTSNLHWHVFFNISLTGASSRRTQHLNLFGMGGSCVSVHIPKRCLYTWEQIDHNHYVTGLGVQDVIFGSLWWPFVFTLPTVHLEPFFGDFYRFEPLSKLTGHGYSVLVVALAMFCRQFASGLCRQRTLTPQKFTILEVGRFQTEKAKIWFNWTQLSLELRWFDFPNLQQAIFVPGE